MDEKEKQRLLDACMEAQQRYLATMEREKERRTAVFAAALRTRISAREIAEVVGLSGSMVAKISKGQR